MKIEKFKGSIKVGESSSNGEIEDVVYESPLLLRFGSYKNPFLAMESYCTNPECDCQEVLLDFVEVDETGYRPANSIQFQVNLDLER